MAGNFFGGQLLGGGFFGSVAVAVQVGTPGGGRHWGATPAWIRALEKKKEALEVRVEKLEQRAEEKQRQVFTANDVELIRSLEKQIRGITEQIVRAQKRLQEIEDEMMIAYVVARYFD